MDQLDDLLGGPIFRCRFPGQNERTRHDQGLLLFEQTEVHVDNVQHIERLPFIFVNTFNLNVEEGIGMDPHAGGFLNDVTQAFLVVPFDLHERLLKRGIICLCFQCPQRLEVCNPRVADALRDQVRQARIGFEQPASLRDPIGFVVKPLGPQLVEIRYQRRFYKPGMESRNAIDRMTSNNCQVSHTDMFMIAFFDDRHALHTAESSGHTASTRRKKR